jgi:WD40 repeat protein
MNIASKQIGLLKQLVCFGENDLESYLSGSNDGLIRIWKRPDNVNSNKAIELVKTARAHGNTGINDVT